jgi:hypothetical protein
MHFFPARLDRRPICTRRHVISLGAVAISSASEGQRERSLGWLSGRPCLLGFTGTVTPFCHPLGFCLG